MFYNLQGFSVTVMFSDLYEVQTFCCSMRGWLIRGLLATSWEEEVKPSSVYICLEIVSIELKLILISKYPYPTWHVSY